MFPGFVYILFCFVFKVHIFYLIFYLVFIRLIFTSNVLDHIPWKGKERFFNYSWFNSIFHIGPLEFHSVIYCKVLEQLIMLYGFFSSCSYLPELFQGLLSFHSHPNTFCHHASFSVSLLCCTCGHSIASLTSNPHFTIHIIIFLWLGVVELCWFLRHDYPLLPDHWHHLSFKKTLRKFPSESAHDKYSLARKWGERFKPNKALTSFWKEPNVLSLQLLLALEVRDQKKRINIPLLSLRAIEQSLCWLTIRAWPGTVHCLVRIKATKVHKSGDFFLPHCEFFP